MANDPSDTIHLVERLRAGDRQALTDLFQRHRDRLAAWSNCVWMHGYRAESMLPM